MADDVGLSELELERASANAVALARAFAPDEPRLRGRIRDALCDAYVAGTQRDAAKMRVELRRG